MYLLHLGAIRYAHVKSPPLISEGGERGEWGGVRSISMRVNLMDSQSNYIDSYEDLGFRQVANPNLLKPFARMQPIDLCCTQMPLGFFVLQSYRLFQ